MERRLGIMQSVEPVLENAIKTLQKVVDVRGMGHSSVAAPVAAPAPVPAAATAPAPAATTATAPAAAVVPAELTQSASRTRSHFNDD